MNIPVLLFFNISHKRNISTLTELQKNVNNGKLYSCIKTHELWSEILGVDNASYWEQQRSFMDQWRYWTIVPAWTISEIFHQYCISPPERCHKKGEKRGVDRTTNMDYEFSRVRYFQFSFCFVNWCLEVGLAKPILSWSIWSIVY